MISSTFRILTVTYMPVSPQQSRAGKLALVRRWEVEGKTGFYIICWFLWCKYSLHDFKVPTWRHWRREETPKLALWSRGGWLQRTATPQLYLLPDTIPEHQFHTSNFLSWIRLFTISPRPFPLWISFHVLLHPTKQADSYLWFVLFRHLQNPFQCDSLISI